MLISIKNSVLLCATLWLISLSLCSCEQDNEALHPRGVAVNFVPSMDSEAATRMETSQRHVAATRVTDNQWSGSETVGVIAFDAESSTQLTASFMQYRTNMEGTHVQLNPLNEANTIYFPTDGSDITFTAFGPYVTPSGNTVTNSLTSQTSVANIEAVDFIHSKGVAGYSQDAPVATLNFEHKMSRVIINFTRGSSYTSSIAAATAQLQGVYTTAACNVLTGVVTPSGSGNITAFPTSSAVDACTFQAIVAPQTSTSTPAATSRKLAFTIGGSTYTIDIPQDFVAGNSYTYNFVFDVTGVTLAGSTVVSWGEGTVAWDVTGKTITTDKNTLTFFSTASTQTVTIKVKGTTTVPTASYSTSAESITGTPACISSSLPIATGTTEGDWTMYTLSVTSTANSGTTNREGFVHVHVDGLSVVIEVTQAGIVNQGDANCYIVAPGTTFTLPLARAVTYGGASTSATFTVTKLWDDAGAVTTVGTPSGTGSSATVTITASNIPGNAVIAARVSGVTVWSWHIWVTSYNPTVSNFTNTYNTNKSGIVFMDRNLGATFAGVGAGYGCGLFYQWGRKDPFPATLAANVTQPGSGSFTTAATSATNGTVAYTIMNPSVFLTSNSTYSCDWYYGTGDNTVASRNNTLWGHGNATAKSVYDPCPSGWRVPSDNVPVSGSGTTESSPWYGLTLDVGVWNNGYTVCTTAQYPASGRRSYGSGTVTNLNYTYVWTASPNISTMGRIFYANTYNATGHAACDRAYGCNVRCARI